MEEMHVLVLAFTPRYRGLVYGLIPAHHRDSTESAPSHSLSGQDYDEFEGWLAERGIPLHSGNAVIPLDANGLFEFKLRWL